jgi:hypothetical protein
VEVKRRRRQLSSERTWGRKQVLPGIAVSTFPCREHRAFERARRTNDASGDEAVHYSMGAVRVVTAFLLYGIRIARELTHVSHIS